MWSPLIFLGTLLFSPFLSLFLALAAIICITELLYIPNMLPIKLLELVTPAWLWCMECAPTMPKIGYPTGPLIILLLLPLGAVMLMWQLGAAHRTLLVSGLVLWMGLYLGAYGLYARPHDATLTIPLGSRTIMAVVRNGEVVLIDNQDILKGRACSTSWVRFTLLPTLIRSTGTCRLDKIIVPCVSKKGLDRLFVLCGLSDCREIVCLECAPELALQVGKENIRLTVLPNRRDTVC